MGCAGGAGRGLCCLCTADVRRWALHVLERVEEGGGFRGGVG